MLGRRGVVVLCLATLVAAGLVPQGGAGADQPPSHALDPTFGQGGKVIISSPPGSAEYGNAVASLPDGSLIIAGTAVPDPDALPHIPIEQIPRTPDGTFVPPDVPTLSQSLGSVLLLLRLLPDGRLDPGFGNGGRVWTDMVKAENPAVGQEIPDRYPLGSAAGYALAIQDDGRILVAGSTATTTSYAFALARYLPDGTLDDSFGDDGLVITELDPLHGDFISTVLLLPHGRILAAGTSGARAALARYLPNGELDRSFGGDGVVFTAKGFLNAAALAQDSMGRIVAAGQGGILEGPYDFAVARYQADGTLDAGFGRSGVVITDLGGTGEGASGLTLGPNGTVVLAGNSSGAFALARYRPDGTLDPAFGKSGVVTAEATGAATNSGAGRGFLALPDGRMLLGGGWYAGENRDVAVARYLGDGSRDPGFGQNGLLTTDVGQSRDDEAAAVVEQRDGKLVVAGLSYKDSLDDVLVFVLRYAHDGEGSRE